MSGKSQAPAAWVLATADALRRNGSWTGRIHIHKHLFITRVLNLAQPPFDFELYDYGPYSFELDERIIDLELFGHLTRSYPKPGYGPRYEPTLQGLEIARSLQPSESQVVERVAERLGDRKSQDLELIATCLWVERMERVKSPAAVVARVRQAKPKYDESTIRRSLDDAHALAKSLAE